MVKQDAYCAVTRQMTEGIKSDVSDIRLDIKDLKSTVQELYNHQSSRLPNSISATIAILSSLTVGLITYLVTH